MSPAAPAVAVPTRSAIEDWTTTHLADAAANWHAAGAASEDAFDQHRANISSPGGTTWEGDAKDTALDRVTADIAVVGTQNEALRAAASIAESAVTDINAAKRDVITAISAAENDGFDVGEDLSVTDTQSYEAETAAARATAAAEHAEDIRWTAERLAQADSLAGQRLQAKAAELEGIRFDGEDETGGDPTIRMVDHKTEAGPDSEEQDKAWQDMMLPPEFTAEGAAGDEAGTATGAADDVAKGPLDESLVPEKSTDPGQPDNLNEALDEVAGKPVPESPTLAERMLNPHTGTGKPGDPRYTKSPLEAPIVSADPSVIEQQLARVEAARADVDAAQAAAAAGQTYVEGAGAGPGARDAVPLGQNLFDARAELTEQTDILEGLNQAAAETGVPTVEVPELPADADVQAFIPDTGVTASEFIDAQKFYSHEISDLSHGLVPNVAEVIDVYNNWGQHSGAEQAGAVLDTVGAVPGAGKVFDNWATSDSVRSKPSVTPTTYPQPPPMTSPAAAHTKPQTHRRLHATVTDHPNTQAQIPLPHSSATPPPMRAVLQGRLKASQCGGYMAKRRIHLVVWSEAPYREVSLGRLQTPD